MKSDYSILLKALAERNDRLISVLEFDQIALSFRYGYLFGRSVLTQLVSLGYVTRVLDPNQAGEPSKYLYDKDSVRISTKGIAALECLHDQVNSFKEDAYGIAGTNTLTGGRVESVQSFSQNKYGAYMELRSPNVKNFYVLPTQETPLRLKVTIEAIYKDGLNDFVIGSANFTFVGVKAEQLVYDFSDGLAKVFIQELY